MKRGAVALAIGVACALALSGCGVQPTGVRTMGTAPSGLATGVTLFFIDEQGDLVPQLRETGRLGTVEDAVSLLLSGPQGSDLHTGIAEVDVVRVERVPQPHAIGLRLPLAPSDVTPTGIDQIVCTALVSDLQHGGSRATRVRLLFTLPDADSGKDRSCPVLDQRPSRSISGASGAGENHQ